MDNTLPEGIYDQLIDLDTAAILAAHPELRSVVKKIDAEETPARFAHFLAKVIETALRSHPNPEARRQVCNDIIGQLVAASPIDDDPLARKMLTNEAKPLLTEITPAHLGASHLARPVTPIWESSLFTGATSDPRMDHELAQELRSADQVDFLVAFIRWSGLRLLLPALEEIAERNVPVRVITTSYMGASEARAVERLAEFPNVSVKVSYDTERTRLHAKAYHFHRASGFSTAYIGSANVSQPALTSGLEWNLKITNQDLPQIFEKFLAEFETYWNSSEFVAYDRDEPARFRNAVKVASERSLASHQSVRFFADITPHLFQERILESLETERRVHQCRRNLVVAATGTGKTVVAAFDYKRFREQAQRDGKTSRLLFVAHRKEILEQSLDCFRAVLRDENFGELQVGSHQAANYDYLFCSNLALQNRKLWQQLGGDYYDFIIVDEVHHGAASSYREIFVEFAPTILLGLTATPERMDGESILGDFDGRLAAEIRLPEALEEKLLCPFHYFAVSDPVSLSDQRFWRAGKYDISELEKVYTGADALAQLRIDAILKALDRYHGSHLDARAVGFCVSVNHAQYMADCFSKVGIPSRALVGSTGSEARKKIVADFRKGEFPFLFVVDIFNEGVDVPEIDTVLFLRPTESLTVFLQQLGRGLRKTAQKDCLTVIDLVGQMHRRYRVDRKFAALLPNKRFRIDREVAAEFPHLPAGCSVILEKQARSYIVESIRRHYEILKAAVTEDLKTFETDNHLPLTFENYITQSGYDPHQLLKSRTWSEWKQLAGIDDSPVVKEPGTLRYGVTRSSLIRSPRFLRTLRQFAETGDVESLSPTDKLRVHYLLWKDGGRQLPFDTVDESLAAIDEHPSIRADLLEITDWALAATSVGEVEGSSEGAAKWGFELHGTYTNHDINTLMGKATFESPWQTGPGVLAFHEQKAYALLITFQKGEAEFSPSTMYEDYPITRDLIHWQSQNNTTQDSKAGLNLTQHAECGYTILIFARLAKQQHGVTMPFVCLGPADVVDFHGERPITFQWKLRSAMPYELFEQARIAG